MLSRPLMADRNFLRLSLSVAASVMLAIAGLASADPDEAWLTHAPTPAGTKPLLIVALDTSAAMAERIPIAEPYDPLRNYAATVQIAGQCDPGRVYWRRGPGPAPDCASMTGLAIGTSTAGGGLRCDAAREALARHGYFVAARAAQWHPSGHWEALWADSIQDVECRSDRGRHGGDSGQWFATDGPAGPWSQSSASEIDWDAPPLGDSYIFYSGNFLNYLAAGGRTIDASLKDAIVGMLSVAVDSTDELDVGIIRTSDAVPDAEGGFVLLAPVSAATAAGRLPALATDVAASGAAPLAETMTEIAAWLSGGDIRYGDDPHADSAARDPGSPARYQSPYLCPCRPVTVAIATAGMPSQDDGAAQVVENLQGFRELTGGCDGNCLPALAQWLAQSDLRDDLPGRQFAALQWIVPTPAPTLAVAANDRGGGKIEFASDPLAFANVMARSLQQDAAVAAGPQLSAAGMLLADGSTHEPAVIFGLSAPQVRERWLGNLLRYGLQPPQDPLAAPVVIGRDGQAAIDTDTGLPKPGSVSEWSDRADGALLLTGGAAGQLPGASTRRIFSNVSADVLTSSRNRLSIGNPAFSAVLLGLGPNDRQTPGAVIDWLLNQRLLGDPGLQAPASAKQYDTCTSKSAAPTYC